MLRLVLEFQSSSGFQYSEEVMDWLLCLQNSLLVVQPLVGWLGLPKSPKLQCPVSTKSKLKKS